MYIARYEIETLACEAHAMLKTYFSVWQTRLYRLGAPSGEEALKNAEEADRFG